MENNIDKNYVFFYYLGVLANLAQLANFDMNIREVTNDEIMKRLIGQDKVLDEQTNIYLKTIVRQNETIIRLLKEKD